MAKSILIVDSNEAFALMLHDSIQREMQHHVVISTTASEAKRSLFSDEFDLVIVDMGLDDEDPLTLIETLRRRQNGMRAVVIPLMGEDLPDKVAQANIQGVLSKPFFIGDLAETIDRALTTPLQTTPAEPADVAEEPAEESSPAEEATEPEPADAPTDQARPLDAGTIDIITDLHRETAAEAVILTGPSGIAAQSGEIRGLDGSNAGEVLSHLSRVVADTLVSVSGTQTQNTEVLHQGFCEGLGRRLYWMTLNREWLLVCVLDIDTPLGMLRYHLRRAALQLSAFAG